MTFSIQIFKNKSSDKLISKLEICIAPSLFEALCDREGELYLPEIFFQSSDINQII